MFLGVNRELILLQRAVVMLVALVVGLPQADESTGPFQQYSQRGRPRTSTSVPWHGKSQRAHHLTRLLEHSALCLTEPPLFALHLAMSRSVPSALPAPRRDRLGQRRIVPAAREDLRASRLPAALTPACTRLRTSFSYSSSNSTVSNVALCRATGARRTGAPLAGSLERRARPPCRRGSRPRCLRRGVRATAVVRRSAPCKGSGMWCRRRSVWRRGFWHCLKGGLMVVVAVQVKTVLTYGADGAPDCVGDGECCSGIDGLCELLILSRR